jgi:hypothetical protein
MFEVDKPTRKPAALMPAKAARNSEILTGNDLGKLGNINQYLRLMRSSLSRKRKPLQLINYRETQHKANRLQKNAIMMPGKFYYHNYGVEGKIKLIGEIKSFGSNGFQNVN